MSNSTSGFTLFELTIVLTIIGLISVWAYPHFNEQLARNRRHDAQAALFDLATQMEHYYSLHQTYKGASIAQHTKHDVRSLAFSDGGWYRLAIVKQTPTDYQLEAIPCASQTQADTVCQILSLSSQGIKSIQAGPAGTPTGNAKTCWE